MSTYGRNFEFRVPPVHGQRGGRYVLDAATEATIVPIGAPVVTTGDTDDALTGATTVDIATGAQAIPLPGQGGIALYEHAPAAFAGYDPVITTFSDIDSVPAGKMCQVVAGERIKVVLRNTVDRTFLGQRPYKGRTMVAALNTLAPGDLLTPGDGDGESGGAGSYWAKTATAADGWLVVESVDTARREVECRLNF